MRKSPAPFVSGMARALSLKLDHIAGEAARAIQSTADPAMAVSCFLVRLGDHLQQDRPLSAQRSFPRPAERERRPG